MKPYRKNCEGYFFDNKDNILARNIGFILFPGGGVDEGEDSEKAVWKEINAPF